MPLSEYKTSDNYDFNASAQTVKIRDDDFASWVSITHIDSGKLMYHVDRDARNGTESDHNIELGFNTANMTDNEPLRIVYLSKTTGADNDDTMYKILKEIKETNKLLKRIIS